MTSSLVSVVIPSYNYGQFVTEAVESALAQTYSRVEVIVVDDGSRDDTWARLVPYEGKIRYIYQNNAGLSAARNTGIEAARGEYVALLDADDLFHPRKLEWQMACFEAHPDVALVASDSFSDPDPQWKDVTVPPRWEPVSLTTIVTKPRFAPSSVVIRKSCFGEVGLFDPALRSVEDRDMWIRIAAQGRMILLRAPLCWYRIHGGSMSHNPGRMEEFETEVLRRAFALPALRGRWLLRRKARSHAALSASYMYQKAGWPRKALYRALSSLLLWPVPHRREEVRTKFVRAKLAAVALRSLVMSMFGCKAPKAQGVTSA